MDIDHLRLNFLNLMTLPKEIKLYQQLIIGFKFNFVYLNKLSILAK